MLNFSFFFLPRSALRLEINIRINSYKEDNANQSHNNLLEEILSTQGTEKTVKEDAFKLGMVFNDRN